MLLTIFHTLVGNVSTIGSNMKYEFRLGIGVKRVGSIRLVVWYKWCYGIIFLQPKTYILKGLRPVLEGILVTMYEGACDQEVKRRE